jgi:hypothetical protein
VVGGLAWGQTPKAWSLTPKRLESDPKAGGADGLTDSTIGTAETYR